MKPLVPFEEDIGEPVISMNGGISLRRGVIGGSNGHIERRPNVWLRSSGKRGASSFIYS